MKKGYFMASSNFDREKVTPQVTNDTTVKTRNVQNFFFRMPAFYVGSNRGAVGTNPTSYVSPHWAMAIRGTRRQCSTSPDLRTAESCEDIPY